MRRSVISFVALALVACSSETPTGNEAGFETAAANAFYHRNVASNAQRAGWAGSRSIGFASEFDQVPHPAG